MEKINKSKLMILIIVVLVVIATIIGVVIFLARNKGNGDDKGATHAKTESEIASLSIKEDINIEYNEESNETKILFEIENMSDKKIENQKVKMHILGEDESLISEINVDITALEPKGSYQAGIILGGNIQGIKKLKLLEAQEEAPQEEPKKDSQE